jgi:ATP-dependent Clp protease ATP-binding subunit ClpX
MRLEIISIF